MRVVILSLLLVFMITIFVIFYFLCEYVVKFIKNMKYFHEISILLGKIYSPIMALLITFLFSNYFNILAEPIAHIQAEKNEDELKKIVGKLIDDVDTDENKTMAILMWFDFKANNVYNAYHLEHRRNAKIYPMFYPFSNTRVSLITKEPYIGIRVYKDEDSLWILTTRYGRCGEFALLFRDMANVAGLKVRRIVCSGENHEWDEVLINNWWVVIDATRAGIAKDNGFNLSSSFMENKIANEKHISHGNVSYVYAEYVDGTRVDVTSTYTNITNITVRVIDEKGFPLSGVKLNVFSHNRDYQRDTRIPNLLTNKSGICTFSIGGGKYTIKAVKDSLIPLRGEVKITAMENQLCNNATIYLKRDFTNIYILVAITIFVTIVMIIVNRRNREY